MHAHRITLIAGDLVAFLIFGALGRASHGMEVSLLSAANAVLPFVLAWLGVGAALKSFDPARLSRPLDGIKQAVLTWLPACPVGFVLRYFYLQRGTHWSFMVMVFVLNLVLLALWRAGYAWYAGRSGLAAAAKGTPPPGAKPL